MKITRNNKKEVTITIMPLIDVIFQLLVFFMLTSSFLAPAIKLNLPKAITEDQKNKTNLVLSINKSGSYFIEKIEIPKNRLLKIIKLKLAQKNKKALDIRGDENMPYKAFLKAMDVSRLAGASTINLLHKSE